MLMLKYAAVVEDD